jgi:hypothetical protein
LRLVPLLLFFVRGVRHTQDIEIHNIVQPSSTRHHSHQKRDAESADRDLPVVANDRHLQTRDSNPGESHRQKNAQRGSTK